MARKCPACGSKNWLGEEKFEEGNNHKSKIYWRECSDCHAKFDEIETIRWEKDSYGRLEIVSKQQIPE